MTAAAKTPRLPPKSPEDSERLRRARLCLDYLKTDDGGTILDERKKLLFGVLFDTPVGASIQTVDQLRVLRGAIDVIEQMAPKPTHKRKAKAAPR